MTSCLGGINIALYDAIGRTLGVPVYNLLGGAHRDRIPAYASTGYLTNDPDSQLADQLERITGQGFPRGPQRRSWAPRSSPSSA